MTFRCPLRNEWSKVEAQFAAMGASPGRDGVMARLMCDMMPVLIDAVERERDRRTSPNDFFDAVAAAAGAMIEEAIEGQTILQLTGRDQHFDRMLALINRVVRPRMQVAKKSRLIVPEY
jgi:hypothetical protein